MLTDMDEIVPGLYLGRQVLLVEHDLYKISDIILSASKRSRTRISFNGKKYVA